MNNVISMGAAPLLAIAGAVLSTYSFMRERPVHYYLWGALFCYALAFLARSEWFR